MDAANSRGTTVIVFQSLGKKAVRRSIFILTVVIGVIEGCPALARSNSDDPQNFQILYEDCKAESRGDFCLGFVMAAGEMMFWVSRLQPPVNQEQIPYACAASSVAPSPGAMIQAVINWGEKHPEHWADDMLVATGLALKATWPCPASR